MMGVGLSEMLILFLMMGGSSGADVVSFVPPKHYFETMEVETTFDKMIELASKEGKDGRTQFQQLIAIRYLADAAEAFKKSAKYTEQRQVLEQIAEGKKANDAQGFAKDQALRTLARLDGKTWSPPAMKKTLREDALDWFPASATLGMAWDGRLTKDLLGGNSSNFVLDMLKMMPPAEQRKIFREIYGQVEKVGNVRLDRVAFAFVEDEKQPKQSKIFIRFTGKADTQRMLDLLKTMGARMEVTEKKDEQGQPYKQMQQPGRPPIFLAFGDSELVMTGYLDDRADHQALVKDVLAIRAKAQPDAARGALKEALAKVPAKACAFMVGTLPEDFRRDFQRGLGDVPGKVQASIEQLPTGFDINLEGVMAKGGDSRMLVEVVSKGRQQAMEGMKQLQNAGQLPPGFPALPFQAMQNTLESMQINGNGANVQMRVMVPNEIIQVVPLSAGFFGMAARPLAPPPPPPKVELKKAEEEKK